MEICDFRIECSGALTEITCLRISVPDCYPVIAKSSKTYCVQSLILALTKGRCIHTGVTFTLSLGLARLSHHCLKGEGKVNVNSATGQRAKPLELIPVSVALSVYSNWDGMLIHQRVIPEHWINPIHIYKLEWRHCKSEVFRLKHNSITGTLQAKSRTRTARSGVLRASY